MTEKTPSPRIGLGYSTRYIIGLGQELLRLFAAGTIIYELHDFFFRYYANEWAGIQFRGVNRCGGLGMIANGDLIGGTTFCNQFLNYFPWLLLYWNHWQAALAYYGAASVIVLAVAWVWKRRQNLMRHRSRADVGQQKTLGDAGHASAAETHAALKGARVQASSRPRFED